MKKAVIAISSAVLLVGLGYLLGRWLLPDDVNPYLALLTTPLIVGGCILIEKQSVMTDEKWVKEWNRADRVICQEDHEQVEGVLGYIWVGLVVLVALASLVGMAMMFAGLTWKTFFPDSELIDRSMAAWGVLLVYLSWLFGELVVKPDSLRRTFNFTHGKPRH